MPQQLTWHGLNIAVYWLPTGIAGCWKSGVVVTAGLPRQDVTAGSCSRASNMPQCKVLCTLCVHAAAWNDARLHCRCQHLAA